MRPLLPLSIALATALRLGLILAGPDTDSDAYGHAMAGRHFLDNPTNLNVHWVWLPLWHVVQGLIALGGGAIEQSRLLNVALGVAPPLLLARLVRRATGDDELAATAGSLLALLPLGLGLGSAGQPEPLFLLLTLGAVVAWHEDRGALAGALLGAAALARYEAWVLPPVFLALWWGRGRPWRLAPAWVVPGLVIAVWCGVHWAWSGEPLLFLKQNREFARQASEYLRFPWGPEPRPALMALWYPVVMPASELRAFAPLAVVGAVAAARRRPALPAALLGAGAAIALFLSYGWVRRLNLGLHRHFYALTPLLAALTAVGLRAAAAAVAERWPRAGRWPLPGLALALFACSRTAPVYMWNFHMNRAAYAPARAAAAELRALGRRRDDRYVCDLPEVEQLTPLPWRQVVRRPASGLTSDEASRLAPPGGRVIVVARPADAAALRAGGRVVREDAGLVVVQIDARP